MSTDIKKALIIGGGVLLLFALLIYRSQSSRLSGRKDILRVTTSFYPLEYLAKAIGGEWVSVTNLTPAGTEPHEYEPSTRDIVQLEKEDIILLNGGGMEGYAEKLKDNIDPKKTLVVHVGQPLMDDTKDAHVWLDPVLYKRQAETIASLFVQKDPAHAKIYTANLQKLVQELNELDADFNTNLHSCSQRNIVTAHSAFQYLAKRYSLNQVTLSGFSPEEEPSAKTLATVTKYAKTNKIGYIFFEELVSPAVAGTIARELGAKTLMLNPIEGLTRKNLVEGKTYLSIQRENLENLKIALNCQ